MIKILVVDDSISSRFKIVSMLSSYDFTIFQAKNGIDAVEQIEKIKPDFILLDLLMPEMTGEEVLEYMQKNDIKIPTAILSADIQYSTKEKCIKLGAVNFINKPLMDAEDIVATIREYVL